MSKYCSDCDNLQIDKKKCDGVYKCSKIKKDVNACQNACDKFVLSYRKRTKKDELYELGKKAIKDAELASASDWSYIYLLVAIAIVALIAKLFGY